MPLIRVARYHADKLKMNAGTSWAPGSVAGHSQVERSCLPCGMLSRVREERCVERVNRVREKWKCVNSARGGVRN